MKDKKKERERLARAKVLRRRAAIRRKTSKERKEQIEAFKSRPRETPIRNVLTNKIDPLILRSNADRLVKMLNEFDDTENARKKKQNENTQEVMNEDFN